MKQGLSLSLLSSALFAALYYYATLMHPLSGASIFAWRVILGLPALGWLITRSRGWDDIRHIAGRLKRELKLWGLLACSAALIGAQLWLFVWAPLHQKGLDVSMGYFLLPLVMVVVGRVVYRERLTAVQTVAVGIAVLGVVHELLMVNAFSWATALVMFGYPPYFMLRRYLRIGSFSTLWFDMLFIAPAALFILATQESSVVEQFSAHPGLFFLVPLLGLLSSAALVAYISASRLLPLGLFGILGYVEPVLLFWVAFLFLDEAIAPASWFTYIPIWIAVSLVAGEGVIRWLMPEG